MVQGSETTEITHGWRRKELVREYKWNGHMNIRREQRRWKEKAEDELQCGPHFLLEKSRTFFRRGMVHRRVAGFFL